MFAKSLTWIIGIILLPSPYIGNSASGFIQTVLKSSYKISSPLPYTNPGVITKVFNSFFSQPNINCSRCFNLSAKLILLIGRSFSVNLSYFFNNYNSSSFIIDYRIAVSSYFFSLRFVVDQVNGLLTKTNVFYEL